LVVPSAKPNNQQQTQTASKHMPDRACPVRLPS
jgi:hypothetical protein